MQHGAVGTLALSEISCANLALLPQAHLVHALDLASLNLVRLLIWLYAPPKRLFSRSTDSIAGRS